MTKKCLDCKSTVIDDLEADMENEVPIWYKKAGNYSLLPKMLNCNDKFNPHKTELKEKKPEISEVRVEVPVKVDVDKGEDGTWIFYWASLSTKELEINGPEAAYGDESNSGLVYSKKNGEATLVLNCPQPYRVDGITYPRHVHYTTLTEDKVWSYEIKTIVVYCHLDYKQMEKAVKSKDHIIINALSEESHDDQSIPDTLNLPVQTLNENNRNEKVEEFIERNIKNYPELEELIKQNKLDVKDVPIITYCAHEKCNASKTLAKHIMNAGYSNVVEYPGGIKEWFDEKDEESDSDEEEVSFFEDSDKYDLNNEYETIIYENEKYQHKLDGSNEILDDDNNVVGTLDGEEIKWKDKKEKDTKEILIESDDESDSDNEDKAKTMIDLINGRKGGGEDMDMDMDTVDTDTDTVDMDTVDTDTDTVDMDIEDDETSSEEEMDYEEQVEDTDTDEEMILDGGKPKKDKVAYDGIYICDSGGSIVTQKKYDNIFRGWGFTFM